MEKRIDQVGLGTDMPTVVNVFFPYPNLAGAPEGRGEIVFSATGTWFFSPYDEKGHVTDIHMIDLRGVVRKYIV